MATSTDPRTTVVVMTRNRRADLLRTLPRHEAPVVLVDNGSTDGSVEAVRARHPDVEVVALRRNEGAVARTVGAQRARTPYVAFADDDSWWEPGALAIAAAAFDEHPRLGLLAGRVLYGEAGRLDPVSAQMAAAPLGQAGDLPGPDVLGFLACAAVVRREAFLATGGFDPVVHFAGEEERVALDLAAAGWGLCYLAETVARHVPSVHREPGRERAVRIARNALLTAVMRRPRPVVAARARRASRRGVTAALPRLPAALRRRRVVPDWLEARVRVLEGVPAQDASRQFA